MRIAIAIACARPDAPLAGNLAATLRQAGDVTVALAAEAHELEPLAHSLGARVVRAQRPGIAAARNAALAACDDPVLALLDDDVVPAPGWLSALRRCWTGADVDLAIAGGPIAAVATGTRPRWLGDDLLGVFGAVDHGAASRLIDGSSTRLLGGNLSLRVDVVRGLGGFWPMRGHPQQRGWFDSEALLQRDVAAAGWQVRWLADATARRLIDGDALTRRALLARRWRHGALLGAIGNDRSAMRAARQVVTSTLGVPVAMLTGSQRRTMSRIARTVENLAVLGRERVARDLLEPTGPTEFRPAVAQPVRPAAHRADRLGSVVLLYHRVDDDAHDPLGLCVSRQHFEEHMDVLASRPILPLDQLADRVRHGRVPHGAIAITFDDGYRDNLVHAAPILERAGIPATVFVATDHVETGRSFASDVIAEVLLGPGARPSRLTLTIGSIPMRWRTDGERARKLAHDHLQAWLRTLCGPEADGLVRQLRAWADMPDVAGARIMSVDELRTLAAVPGISIGAHSQRHLSLARQDEDTRCAELEGSFDDVLRWTGARPAGIAYPYGVPGEDVDEATTMSATAAGYYYGVVNSAGLVRPGSDPMALPRLAVPDVGGAELERMLRRLGAQA